MKSVMPFLAGAAIALLACEPAPPTYRGVLPDTATADTTVTSAPQPQPEPAPAKHTPGRGFRMNGNLIVADTFDVRHELRGGKLELALRTDLGDETEVFVSVARTYRERGSTDDFIIEYYNEAGTVGTWRAGKTIDLGATDFWGQVAKLQRAMGATGAPFEVGSIADDLRVDVVVYPGQKPPFDSANANLTGKAVSIANGNRVIEKHLTVRYPLAEGRPGR